MSETAEAALTSSLCPRCKSLTLGRWGYNRSGSPRVGCRACKFSFTPGRPPVRVTPEQWAIVERCEAAGCTLKQAALISQVSERWLRQQRPALRGVIAKAKRPPMRPRAVALCR